MRAASGSKPIASNPLLGGRDRRIEAEMGHAGEADHRSGHAARPQARCTERVAACALIQMSFSMLRLAARAQRLEVLVLERPRGIRLHERHRLLVRTAAGQHRGRGR